MIKCLRILRNSRVIKIVKHCLCERVKGYSIYVGFRLAVCFEHNLCLSLDRSYLYYSKDNLYFVDFNTDSSSGDHLIFC